jgi:hypothetical protein
MLEPVSDMLTHKTCSADVYTHFDVYAADRRLGAK